MNEIQKIYLLKDILAIKHLQQIIENKRISAQRRRFIAIETIRLLNLKLALEKPFLKELKEYFVKQSNNISVTNPNLIDIKPYLIRHYERIIKKLLANKRTQTANNIKNRLNDFIDEHSKRQSALINKKTEKDMETSIKLSDTKKQKEIRILFRKLSKQRETTIKVTETQEMVEKSRNVITNEVHNELNEAIFDRDEERINELTNLSNDYTSQQVLNGIENNQSNEMLYSFINNAVKIWVTMGDAKVRDIHNEANGQQVLINMPFIVGGEALMHPGDYSLGASAGNIANCRCNAVY